MNRRYEVVELLAWLGFSLSVLIHLWTFIGNPPVFSWVLHLGLFPLWFILMMRIQRNSDKLFFGPRKFFSFNRFPWGKWLSRVPLALKILAGILMNYVTFNFLFVGFVLLSEGNPQEVNGRFALMNHGEFLRNLSEQEYFRMLAYQARLFSGHWMIFYLATAIGLSLPDINPEEFKGTV